VKYLPDDYLWSDLRLRKLRTDRIDVANRIDECASEGIEPPSHLGAELSRISWLIGRHKGVLSMARTMYDSTTPENIPADAQIVAYYPHAWGTDLSEHPHALIVRIDNTGAHADDCHILDVEAGAASNATAHEWVMSWHKLHPQGMDAVNGWIRKPVLYASTGALPGLRTACAGLDYDVWAAQWDGSQSPIAGCFARQYVDHGPSGENYDMSLVFDDTWGVKPVAPPTPPQPHPPIPAASLAALLVWGVGPDICSWRQVHSTDGGKTWV
jgi:hypothetical protein